MSQIARDLIKNCLETQSTFLELGNCGLSNLDELPELWDCTHLKQLILSADWFDFEKSTRLYSANKGTPNLIRDIPHNINGLKRLTTLVIHGSELPPSGYGLTRIGISKINILSLVNLQYLDLSKNAISAIEGLENNQSLRILNLSSNRIGRIEGFYSLKSLREIYLESNRISKLEGLDSLKQLKVLNLKYNDIRKLEGLENQSSLEILNLAHNSINKMQGLENCIKLSSLDLTFNHISNCNSLLNYIWFVNRKCSIDLKMNNLIDAELNAINKGYVALKDYYDSI